MSEERCLVCGEPTFEEERIILKGKPKDCFLHWECFFVAGREFAGIRAMVPGAEGESVP